MIHIEGMGWLGSALAWRLTAAAIPFTWHDIDAPHVAWRACTGCVYPAADARSRTNMDRWPTLAPLLPAGTVAQAAYCYAHKNPPHGGTYRVAGDLGWLRVADAPAYVVDAAAVVDAARTRFAAQRSTGPAHGQPVIVAHGHTARRATWVWGWSAAVQLEIPAEVYAAAAGRPVILYGRAHRFAVTYAYPIVGRPGWWRAGSSLMSQRNPKPLDAAAHFAAWRGHAAALYPPVRVLAAEDPVQGWRPKAAPTDTADLRAEAGRLVFPPMGASGVRWAPQLLDAAATWARDALSGGGGAW